MTDEAIRQLAAAVMLQAVKDYFDNGTKPEKRKAILKDLRSNWMQAFSSGVSINIAEQLEKHPKEIRARLIKNKEK